VLFSLTLTLALGRALSLQGVSTNSCDSARVWGACSLVPVFLFRCRLVTVNCVAPNGPCLCLKLELEYAHLEQIFVNMFALPRSCTFVLDCVCVSVCLCVFVCLCVCVCVCECV